jgi:multiple sugar transport system permease protein
MAQFEEVGPTRPILESIRVDKVSPRARAFHNLRAFAVLVVAIIGLIPVFVMILTAFKTRADVVSDPPKVFFSPTLEGFVYLLTERALLPQARLEEAQANAENLGLFERIALESGQEITAPSDYVNRLKNSLIVAGVSTVTSVVLGLFAAYAFSRFDIKGKDDLLFFILSTRMLPAVVITIPLFLMYRQLGLHDTYLGMILLYTVFNLSFSVWLLKGFIDEIPREYEEAALVDGYTRLQAFFKIVLPQAVTGIAATTVFCLIFAWNEYAFALMLTSDQARTAPPSIATMLGRGGIEWSAIAAGSLGFLIPVVIITFALRNYLLRGVTFGAIRQ